MAAGPRRRGPPRREEKVPFNVDAWTPKTELGRKVKAKEIVSVEEIFEQGKPILEYEIIEALLPNLTDNLLEITTTQRMTDCGRKITYRAISLVGDGNGHIGIGVGKAAEAKPAIEQAIKYAKRNVLKIPLGCGSWECGCNTRHSVPITVKGSYGSVKVTIKPAPRGLGIAASGIVKQVLKAAGINDAWTFTTGKTSSIYNTAMATLDSLDSLNRMKVKGDWETRNVAAAPKAEEAAPSSLAS